MSVVRYRECRRCGQRVRVTPSGHVFAHGCKHGRSCMLTYAERRRGLRAEGCPVCSVGRQLPLPWPVP